MPKHKKILLVDDFEMVRMMLKNTLGDFGFTNLVEADDGEKALKLIEEAQASGSPFDMVFCDWTMPVMSGYELLNVLRAKPAFQKLPFIMVTAEAEQENVIAAVRSGADGYLVKPISPDMLQKKVNQILQKIAARVA